MDGKSTTTINVGDLADLNGNAHREVGQVVDADSPRIAEDSSAYSLQHHDSHSSITLTFPEWTIQSTGRRTFVVH
jgi:hypothetical protein